MSVEHFDVVVVGLGPVGAAVANLLGGHGVRTLVVEQATEINRAPRAIALDNEALRVLLVYKPAETITELSTFSDLSPGDVLLTGTPAGCALRAPKRFVRNLMQLVLPEPQLWRAFVRAQSRRVEYLKPGDVVRATIASEDRAIDLGEQRHTIEGSP